METVVLDGLIRMLLDGRNDKQVDLSYEVIGQLCTEGKKIFLSQPNLLRLTAPITICGDIRGQFQDLLKIFTLRGYPPNSTYLFLGNYVDHKTQNFKTLCLLLAYKVKYPDRIFLLRGNQERGFGHRYGIWKAIKDCFDCLPFAGLVEEKIFCVHGGLSPELHRPEEIKDIKRPIEIPDHGLLFDLIWSDPHPDTAGWGPSERGVPHFFGPDMLVEFLDKNDLDLVCRSHSVVEDGYEFFAERRLVTIFSAPNYRGEFSNAGALLVVDETLLCSFEVFGSQVGKGLKSVPYKICQNMIVSKEVGSKNLIEKHSGMIVSKEVKSEIFSGHLDDEFMGIDLSDFSTWESPTEVANHDSFAGPDSGEAAYKDTLKQVRILRTADFSSSVPVAAIHDCLVATTKALELRGLSHDRVTALRNLRSDLLPLASKLFSHCQATKSLKTTMEAVEQQSIDLKQKREFLEERTEALKRKKEEYVAKDLELNRLRAELVRLEEEAAELKASVDRDLSAVRAINSEVVGGFAELKKANAALPTYRKQLSEEEIAVEEHSRRLSLLFDIVEDL